MYLAACILVFVVAYTVTIVVTSVGYHRGLAHGSLALAPWARRALIVGGPWLTGFDTKAWVVMHRMHHLYSDGPEDPHSPANNTGFLGIFKAQLLGYSRTQQALRAGDPKYTSLGRDLELSWQLRTGHWFAPYVVHAAVGVVVGLTVGWGMAIALVAGLLSHVVQGAIINYFGHARGPRNFDTDDNSRNNAAAAWILLGEGYQNNHHRYPSSARFSYRRGEVDLGYGVCRALEALGVLRIVRRTLIPTVS